MKESLHIIRMLACIPALLAVLLFPNRVMAADGCSVDIPIVIEATDAPTGKLSKVQVTLRGQEADAPMPSRSVLTAAGSGEASFGPITYTVPGDYHYKVEQKPGTDEACTYDETVYTLTVRVVNQKDGSLAAEIWAVPSGSSDKVDSLRFVNRYAVPTATPVLTQTPTPAQTQGTSSSTPPKTGDDTSLLFWCFLLALSGTAALLAWQHNKKECV